MSIEQALDAHRNNAKRLIQSGMVTDQQGLARAELANQNNLEVRRQDLAAQQAAANNASERRAQNLSFAQSLAKPAPSASGLGGLSTLLGDTGLQSSLSPSMIAAGNTGMATVGARQGEWTQPNAYATGGMIDGPPPPPDGSDNVDIKVKAGEYVLPPEAVQLLGLDFLDRIVEQSTGRPPVHGGTPTEDGKAGFNFGGRTGRNPHIPDPNAPVSVGGRTGQTPPPQQVDATAAIRTPQRNDFMAGWRNMAQSSPTAIQRNTRNTPLDNMERVLVPPNVLADIHAKQSALEATAAERAAVPRNWERLGSWAGNAAQNIRAGRYINTPPAESSTNTPLTPPATSQTQTKANLDTLRNDPSAMRTLGQLPATAGGLQLFAEQQGPRAQAFQQSATEQGAGDNVQGTDIYGKDSAGKTKRVYKNVTADGQTIYSDSFRGATQQGFDADFAKSGNYVGDPTTGRGLSLPNSVGQGGRMGLSELSRSETAAMMNGYTPARQSSNQALRDQANLAVMRQWQGRDIGRAPDDVRELFGKAPSLDASVARYTAQQLSPEGQAQRQQHELGLAALAAGRQRAATAKAQGGAGNKPYSSTVLGAFKDQFGEQANDAMLSTVMDLAPTLEQFEPNPELAAALLYRAAQGVPSLQEMAGQADKERSVWRGNDADNQRVQATYQYQAELVNRHIQRNLELLLRGQPPIPWGMAAQ